MFLKARDWYARSMHGNMFQSGVPDIYCCHARFGHRWIECKVDQHYKFTKAQLEEFPKMSACGGGVWILTAATQLEYEKLWLPPNWHEFLPQTKIRTRVLKSATHEYVPKYPTPGVPKSRDKK